jgi:methyl-accepting chemotaxis protein
MFDNMSIKKKMYYLITMATFSIFSATIFVFVSMTKIENEYEHLHKNSMTAGLITLEIEKNLNYVSRTTRDIMLGGDYSKDLKKLDSSIEAIRNHFNTLENMMKDDSSLQLIKDAKSSTMLFLDNSNEMMKSLTSEQIKNDTSKIYKKYKTDLTPYANASRSSFKKLVKLKREELDRDSQGLGVEISFYKYLVLVAGTIIGTVVLIIAILIRRSITNGIEMFTQLIAHSAKGDFSHECDSCNSDTELGIMGRNLTALLSHVSSLIKEINISITDASQGKFTHQMNSDGMEGEFVVAINNVAKSI